MWCLLSNSSPAPSMLYAPKSQGKMRATCHGWGADTLAYIHIDPDLPVAFFLLGQRVHR